MESFSKLVYKCIFRGYGFKRNLDLSLYPNIYNYIVNLFDDSYSIHESLRRYFLIYSNNISNDLKELIIHKPKCKTCGNPVKFIGKKNKMFSIYCCSKCSNSNPDVIKNKQTSDKLKHNGIFGWNISSQNKIENRKNTLIKNFGSYENYKKHVVDKRKKTMIQKYNVGNPMHYKEFQDKRNTTLKNQYGTSNLLLVPEIQDKRNSTIKKLRKITKSKQEDIVYSLLVNKFPDTIRQYFDKDRYPFLCDFYIPSLDLFVEYNGSQFHHHRPYIGNQDDLKEIKLLEEKSNKLKNKTGRIRTQYDMIIYVWSDLDVRKRNIAKQNHLNFKEFFSICEVKEFLLKI